MVHALYVDSIGVCSSGNGTEGDELSIVCSPLRSLSLSELILWLGLALGLGFPLSLRAVDTETRFAAIDGGVRRGDVVGDGYTEPLKRRNGGLEEMESNGEGPHTNLAQNT